MNKTENPISLLNFMAAATEAWGDSTDCFAPVDYDDRSDFLHDADRNALAVWLRICNERFLAGDTSRGVRRQVSVILIDSTLKRVVCRTTVPVSIGKDRLIHISQIALRFVPSSIIPGHRYRLMIRDENSRRMLGEKNLRFFNRLNYGLQTDELFEVTKAALTDYDCSRMTYRSVPTEMPGTFKIRFDLRPRIGDDPEDFPEMEMRTFLPDGNRECRFVRVFCDCGVYCAEIPFCPVSSRRGVTYAEIRCLGESFGGIIFNTDGPLVYGAWSGEDVLPLSEYTYPEAVEYLERTIGNPGPE